VNSVEYLSKILLANRKINKLFLSENDPQKLIQALCDILAESCGYYFVWIALFNKDRDLLQIAQTGMGKELVGLIEIFKTHSFPEPIVRALDTKELVYTHRSSEKCPLSLGDNEWSTFTMPIQMDGEVLGVACAALPCLNAEEKQQQMHFENIINDIAFALNSIRKESDLKQLIRNSPDGMLAMDAKMNFLDVNPAFCSIFQVNKQDAIGLNAIDAAEKKLSENAIDAVRNAINTLLKKEDIDQFEINFSNKTISISVKSTMFSQHYIATFRDITLAKEREKSIIESEQKYKNLIDSLTDSVFILQDGVIKYVNPELCRLAEMSENELIGHSFALFIAPAQVDKVMELYEMRAKGESVPVRYESVAKSKSGKLIDVQVSLVPVQYEGKPAFQILLKDISEYKNALKELKESEEKSIFLAKSTFEGIVIHKKGVVLDVNDSFLKITGYTKEEALGTNLLSYLRSAKDKARVLQQMIKRSAQPYTVTGTRKNGETFVAELEAKNVKHLGQTVRIVALRDISERDRLQKQFDESERKLKTLMGNLPGMAYTCMFNRRWDMNFMSDGCFDLLGYLPEELVDSKKISFNDVIHPDDRDYVWDTIEEAVKHNSLFELEYRIITKNGFEKWVWEKGKCIDPDGNQFLEGFISDITERKMAEEDIVKFKTISDQALYGSVIVGATGKLVYVNDYFAQIHGYTPNELIGKHYSVSHSKEQFVDLEKIIDHVVRIGQIESIEIGHKKKNGDEFPMLMSITSMQNKQNGQKYIAATAFDLTESKKAEAKLKKESDFSRKIIDLSPAFIIMLDNEQKIVSMNQAMLKILGYSKQEVVGRDYLNMFISNDEADLIRNDISKGTVLSDLTVRRNHVLKKDGNKIFVEWYGAPMKNEKKEVEAFLGIGIDITERNIHEHKIKKLQQAIESSKACIVITDTKGNIEYANPYFTNSTGYSPDEYLGQNPRILKTDMHDDEYYANLWNTILSGKTWEGEFCNKRKNGELYWEKSIISPIEYKGKITSFVAVKTDITEEKRITKELNAAKERAEESDRLKSAFLANMSHEIRTPMNGILGFTSLLQEPDLTGEEQEQYINIIQKSGDRMLNTINDIINISKIEAGLEKVQISEFDINEMLRELYHFFLPQLKTKGLDFYISEPLEPSKSNILSDPDKIHSILTNLIKNAIKFTLSGSISIDCSSQANGIQIVVQDTGIGIPENRQKAIFERFVQADLADARAFEGSGLGLAITKSYVEMLGGTIRMESKVNVGSDFYVSFPNCRAINTSKSVEQSVPENQSPSEVQTMKILIVEDEQVSFDLLSIALNSLSKEILRAADGEEAVRLFQQNQDTDLILMDIKLPKISGLEASRQIRMLDSKVLIIAQTAYAQIGDKQKALDAGCNDYISKPIDIKQLKAIIQQHLNKD